MNNLPENFDIWQQTLHWSPTPQQQHQFNQLYKEILLANRQINLTRITDPADFWEKHLWDSLSGILCAKLDKNEEKLQVIDIGTGAGFPGIPVAIAFPQWKITLIDSTRKKMHFVDTLITHLQLTTVSTLIGRVEEKGQDAQHRQQYDLALIRAVAEPSVCAEYVLPLLKIGGIGILYRGQWQDADTKTLKPALKKLGGQIRSIIPLQTPLTQGIRHCITIQKMTATPTQFPRAVGIAQQNPLQ